MSNLMHQVHQIRRDWHTVKCRLCLATQKVLELERELMEARRDKSLLQDHLTGLEIYEKEILGQVQVISPVKVKKAKVEKAVDDSLKASLKKLSQSERDELVKSLMEGLV